MAPMKLTAGVPASIVSDQSRIGRDIEIEQNAEHRRQTAPTECRLKSNARSLSRLPPVRAAAARSPSHPARRHRDRPQKSARATTAPPAAARSTTCRTRCGASRLRSGPSPSGINATTSRKNPSAVPIAPPSRMASFRSRRDKRPESVSRGYASALQAQFARAFKAERQVGRGNHDAAARRMAR